jgi:uncharacterized protein YwgA
MKTEKQKISQLLLLLKILETDNNIFGNLKLQKQVFLNELTLTRSNIGALYYKYFRYNYGPFSADLMDDYNVLAHKGFIHKTTYSLTERGEYLIEYIEGFIRKHKNNEHIFRKVEKTTERYKRYNGTELMQKVYRLVVEPEDMPGQSMKVKDIPAFKDILMPECHEFKYALKIPPRILDDVKTELAMDQDEWGNLERTRADAVEDATKSLMRELS